MMPTFLLQLIRPFKKCERCGHMHPRKAESCEHCAGVSDGPALENLRQQHQQRLAAGSQLGLNFMLAAVVLLVVILILL